MTENMTKWYVVHTYSGYENKVKANIEKVVENRNLQDLIFEIKVPLEEVVETKDDQKKTVMRKIYPGYVFIKMILTDDSWYVIRNTRGVTGFVGSGVKPIPLTEEEVVAMGVESVVVRLNFDLKDNVKVVAGPLSGFIGVVEDISMEKRKVKVIVSLFGRDTPVELDFEQVEAL